MHVVLFDIDGTLVKSGGAGKAAMEAALASAFAVPADTAGVPFTGRTDRAIGRDLFQHHGIEPSAANWDRFLGDYLGHLPGCLTRHTGCVLPGIAGLVALLAARPDVLLGLLTGNIRAGARLKLAHFELFHFFRCGGFGDQHFDRDDVARDALADVRRHHPAVDPARVWVIGDTPLDVQCARAIGARAAAVATGWHSAAELAAAGADLALQDLADPSPLLAMISDQ